MRAARKNLKNGPADGRGRAGGDGRDMSRLLSDFGHELPSAPPALHPPKDARLFRHVPSRGARRPGRGWASGVGAGLDVADDLRAGAGVLAVHLHPRAAADRGADGDRPALRRLVLRRPARLGPRRRRPGHQPQHLQPRQTRPRQVRHDQGVLPADDGLRLPRPRPGRPEGRVRAAVPVPRRGTVRDRARPAGADQPARVRAADHRLGPAQPASRRKAGRRSSSPAG